jgi:hypothetical protein
MTRRLTLTLAAGCTMITFGAHSAPPPYAPGLGDFMTAYVQPHHLKLWYAGKVNNWPLAAYEADELGESFEDVSTYAADWEGIPVAQLVKAMIEPPLEKVKAAIEAKSAGDFNAAYTTLTAACSACHIAAKKPFIEIKIPTESSPFTDQNFAPH